MSTEITLNKEIRNKGKNLIELPNDYTIIDIETTGLDTKYDEIIEISAIKIKNNEIVNQFSSLIRPKFKIDDFISTLTGITNEMLENAPKLEIIISEFINFIGDDIIIGHNVNFDINFIYDYYKKYCNKDIKNDFVDTMRIAKKLLPQSNSYKLEKLLEYFNINVSIHHRALSDCESTFKLYNELKKCISNEYGNIENFKNQTYNSKLRASQITTNIENFDEENLLYQKNCVFTGTLEKMARKDAMQHVVDLGGYVQDSLNKKTDYLIVGQIDYNVSRDNKTGKIKKAEDMKLKGIDIQIIPESVFYEML